MVDSLVAPARSHGAPDAGVVMLDGQRRVVLASGAGLTGPFVLHGLQGASLDALIGENAAADLAPIVDEALAGRSASGEVALADGRLLAVRGVPCDVAGAACVLSARDLTRERQLESRLRQAHGLETVGALARRMAHDFNNLLMGIIGCADLAQRFIEADSRAHPFLDELKQAALRGSALTRQLLVVARKGEARPALMRLDQAVTECERLLKVIATDAIRLEHTPSQAGWAVRADHVELQQALVHLVLNARDAMPGGGTVRITTSEVALSPGAPGVDGLGPGDYCVLSVEDDGAGMSEEVLARAFEPFYTTDAAARSGLGLTAVAETAKRAGGAAAATSTPGVGTRVSLYLPRAQLGAG